ncbi:IclR family transcriptional regulator [Nitriliruptor alkaliphilus]|uniref:IclR family transcriptional regulator n=1 Tax=Nitriliruptor alkaliphilus TaxID=427918 RepID=UPI0006965E02|nr:IclR family transcriptional regulator [Nitriliruptor alkaliphilus]
MIQSVDRAVSVLLELQGARRLGLTELASRMGLANSTVHGIVQTLVARGMVEQDTAGRYALGAGVLLLGNVYLDSNELRLRSTSWADALSERTGYAVRVGVILGGDIVVVHHVMRPDGSRQMREIGIDIPAHGTALGKAVLAFHAEARATLPSDVPLRRLTGRTVVDTAALDEVLADVRAGGIARAEDEAVIGESEVAAPIFDAKGAVAGAIAIVVPTSDLPLDAGIEDAVRRAAIDVSRDLGAPTWPVGLPDQRAV